MNDIIKDKQYIKFSLYGFLKNLRFFDAFFILFLVEKGLPYTQIGILYAVREIFINVFEIPSGIIADTYGRKKSLVGSLIAYIISFYIFYISNSFWIFLVAFVFYGIGDAFRSGTHKGMIMDYLKLNNWTDKKITYYGYTRSWSQKGSAISSLIAGIIVFYSGTYKSIFLYSIIPYLFNLLLILSYPKELDVSINKKNRTKVSLVNTVKSLFYTIKKPKVIKLVNTSAMHTAYLKAIKDYIQPIIVNVSIVIPILLTISNEKKSGLIIGIIYFVIYLLTSWASKASSKIAGKSNIALHTLIIGFSLGAVCGILYIKELWIISMILFIGIYIIENIRKPILTGFISDNVPNEILTSVISAQSLLRTIITAIIAFTFGVFADEYGIGYALTFVSILLAISTLALNLIPNSKKN